MKWKTIRTASEPLQDAEDKSFSFLQELPLILSAHKESFSSVLRER